jgi:hypothetical protein
MPPQHKTIESSFAKKFIIGFGYLNGLWLAVGTSPSDEVLKLLQPFVSSMPEYLKWIFVLAPSIITLLTLITIVIIYKKGGIIGGATVILAFFAGGIIFKNTLASIGLLVVAFLIGSMSFKKN